MVDWAKGGTGMTARLWLLAVICHLIAMILACPAGNANPSPGPSPERGGEKNQSPPSLLGKGAGGLGSSIRFEFESKHMGTTFRIVLYANDEATSKKAADAAF